MTPQEIKEIRGRLDKAVPDDYGPPTFISASIGNEKFFSHAREDMQNLLEYVDKLRSEIIYRKAYQKARDAVFDLHVYGVHKAVVEDVEKDNTCPICELELPPNGSCEHTKESQ